MSVKRETAEIKYINSILEDKIKKMFSKIISRIKKYRIELIIKKKL